jgi:uncharacterized cupin superfamily protein
MPIKQLKSAKNIVSEKLDDWGKPKTIGEPLCHLRGLQIIENEDGSEGGIWECTPGKFTREIMQAMDTGLVLRWSDCGIDSLITIDI